MRRGRHNRFSFGSSGPPFDERGSGEIAAAEKSHCARRTAKPTSPKDAGNMSDPGQKATFPQLSGMSALLAKPDVAHL